MNQQQFQINIGIRGLSYDTFFLMSSKEISQDSIEVQWIVDNHIHGDIDCMILEKSNDGHNFYGIALYNLALKMKTNPNLVSVKESFIDQSYINDGFSFYRMRLQFKDKMIITTPPCLTLKQP